LATKVIFVALGALGFVGLWIAVFADMGVSLLVTANAMRLLRSRDI
jgi:Cd2+/Zn2+-exporting ATPase